METGGAPLRPRPRYQRSRATARPSADLADQREHRQVHGDHDGANDDAEERDDHGFDQRHHSFDGGIYFVLVKVCDLREHRIHRTSLLTNPDHLADHGRELLGTGQRFGDGFALLDLLADLHESFLDDSVARGPSGDFE